MTYLEKFNNGAFTKILSFTIALSLTFLKVLFSFILLAYIFYTALVIYENLFNLKEVIKLAITNGLYIFILIEVIRSLNDYFRYKRVKITSMIDISLVFLLRELVIGIFQHSYKFEYIIAISLAVLILVISRVFTIKFSPKS